MSWRLVLLSISNEQLTMLSSYQRTMIQMSFVLRMLDENPTMEHFIQDIFESPELTTEMVLVTLDWLEAIGVEGEAAMIRYLVVWLFFSSVKF